MPCTNSIREEHYAAYHGKQGHGITCQSFEAKKMKVISNVLMNYHLFLFNNFQVCNSSERNVFNSAHRDT